MKHGLGVTLALITLLTTGCSVKYVTVDQSYQYGKKSPLAASRCQFVLGKIADERRDKESLGNLGFSFVSDSVTYAGGGAGPGTAPQLEHIQKPVHESGGDGVEAGGPGRSGTLAWLIHGLNSAGFLNTPDSSGRKIIPVNISLKLAYIKNSLTAKASNIVLGVNFGKDSGSRIIRGSSSSINWVNGEGEIRSSFNRSLDEAIQKLNSTAIDICS